MKKINFSAGPSILPQIVFEEAAQGIRDYQNMGLSILEISHRTTTFDHIIEGAKTLIKELGGLNDDYEVLFLTGGASTQFCLVPYNLLPQNGTAAYIDTGKWSDKAIKEAQLFGNTTVLASSKAANYQYIPKGYTIPQNVDYLHITTNNTVVGTQFHHIPTTNSKQLLIADMSSDIFASQMDLNQFDLIYAGAQKNLGPAGVTIVILKKSIVGRVKRAIPTMLNYQTHIDKKSMFNTPPVFSIYGCYLNLKWLKKQGLAQMEAQNKAKAALLYTEIDRNSLFKGNVAMEDRSIMNATFDIVRPELLTPFLAEAEARGCVALKGHRSVGGLRASMYNALPLSGVGVLVETMQDFEKKYR